MVVVQAKDFGQEVQKHLVEGLEIVNFLLDNFPFHRRVGLSIDLSEEMGSLVMVEHHSRKKERDEGHWECLEEW
ncbi:hypothetical protein Tco_0746645 [Tanacetum coccineum]